MAMQATGLVASSSTRTGISSRKAASPWVHAHPDIGHRYPFPVFPAGVVGRPLRQAVRTRSASEERKASIPLVLSHAQPSPTPPLSKPLLLLKIFTLSLSL
jgi:hypothetical protein